MTVTESRVDMNIVVPSGEPMILAKAILAHNFKTERGMPSIYLKDGDWYQYRENRWQITDRVRLEDDVCLALASIWVETKDPDTNKKVRKPLRTSKLLLATVFRCIEALCRVRGDVSMPSWLKPVEGWNDDFTIAFEDVVVDVKASALQGKLVTRERTDLWFDPCVLPCKLVVGAKSPTLEKCLREWSSGEEKWKETWLRGIAYTLMAHREARLFLNYGVPRSGKGVTEDIRRMLMGKDVCANLQMSTLAKNFGKHKLSSARALIIPEVSELDKRGAEEASAVLKQILGKDPFDIDRKYQDPAQNVVSGAAIVMLGNQMPNLSNAGGGLSSKIVPLYFEKSFVGQENWDLGDTLRGEVEGIAYMVLEAAIRMVAEKDATKKFPLPVGSQVAMEKFLALNNPADGFLEWGYIREQKGMVSPEVVYGDYLTFCEKLPMKPLGRYHFYRWIETQNSWGVFKSRNTKTGFQVYRGLKRKDQVGFEKAGVEVDDHEEVEILDED